MATIIKCNTSILQFERSGLILVVKFKMTVLEKREVIWQLFRSNNEGNPLKNAVEYRYKSGKTMKGLWKKIYIKREDC